MKTTGIALAAVCALVAGAAVAQTDLAANPLGLTAHHITVGVASIEVERQFYHDVLGFEVGAFHQRPQYDHQQMLISGFRIDMIQQKGSSRPAASMGTDKQGWLHVAFTVPAADRVYVELKRKGVTVSPGRMDGAVIGSVFVTDPEGNRVELASPEARH